MNNMSSTLTQQNIEAMTPHVNSFVREEMQKAYDAHLETDEYKAFTEEYIGTEDHTKEEERMAKKLSRVDDYLKILKKGLDSQEKITIESENTFTDSDFNWTLKNLLGSAWDWKNAFGVHDLEDVAYHKSLKDTRFTKENWKELVKSTYKIVLEEKIEAFQKNYATNKMNLTKWVDSPIWNELGAMMQTIQKGTSVREVEALIKNQFNFSELTRDHNDDCECAICIA